MPAKRPALRSAKGKKAASRPAVRKATAHKPEPLRVRAVAAPPHKTAPPPKKPGATAPGAASEPAVETRKPLRPGAPASPPRAATSMLGGNRVGPAPAATADGEDAELVEPGSLLAGPRNVQPYIAKRGEQYMSKEQLQHFRNILNSWKRDLMVEVDRTVTHMKDEAANFPDPNDRATQEEEFSLELRTRDRERKLIRKIDDALKRIEDGSYGYCLETGEEIGIKRLEARPVATLSIEAQERRERRERQYGDRDDRYR